MDPIERFKQMAKVSSTTVVELEKESDVIDYLKSIEPEEKKPIVPDKREPQLDKKILGTWNIAEELIEKIQQDNDFWVVKNSFRQYLGGLDFGLFWADFAVANTGTLIVKSFSEDLRILTMFSEINVVFLNPEDIVLDFEECAQDLNNYLSGGGFVSFITGPSRTADIERVLTLGVHGPWEVHVVLLSQEQA
ncbi:MAG: lactate utilization protein [Desulfonauticus sp.]|nr:lactate utilization protein [Desulfonauticus sp.]